MRALFLLLMSVLMLTLCILWYRRRSKLEYADSMPYSGCHSDEICLRAPEFVTYGRVRNDDIRLGIVVMTKNPIAFETWLAHHRSLNVQHFFIRIEDTPDLHAALQSHADLTLVASSGTQSYFAQITRQNDHVNRSIVLARKMGLTHLLHIDDDELLFCPHGKDIFRSALSKSTASNLRLSNMEAVYDFSDCTNPFLTTRQFRKRPWEFGAYTNGKSIGRLDDWHLAAKGPHVFTGLSEDLDAYLAVILHYESACLHRWKTKFRAYMRDSPSTKAGIPFAYFKESLEAIEQAEEHETDAIWRKWKLAHHATGLETLTNVVRR